MELSKRSKIIKDKRGKVYLHLSTGNFLRIIPLNPKK